MQQQSRLYRTGKAWPTRQVFQANQCLFILWETSGIDQRRMTACRVDSQYLLEQRDGLVDALGKTLRKGMLVEIVGQIETREWEKDGDKRYATEAYFFVRDGLEYTVKNIKKGARGLARSARRPAPGRSRWC